MDLERDYTLDEVAEALGMSTRWVRQRIQAGAEHQRYGRKIRFTRKQFEDLRSAHTRAEPQVPLSITTGKKRRNF
jgi:hypothetical protein